jgi:hypothetical protein
VVLTERQKWKLRRLGLFEKPPPRPRGRPRNDEPPAPRNNVRWVKHTRWALLKDSDHVNDDQFEVLHELRRNNSVLHCSWQLEEGRAISTDCAIARTRLHTSSGGCAGPVVLAYPPS